MTPALAHALTQTGLSWTFYVVFHIIANLVAVAVWSLVASIIIIRRSAEPIALLAAFALVLFGGTTNDILPTLIGSQSGWEPVAILLSCLGSIGILTLFALFPDGRCLPSWLRWVIGGWWVINLLGYTLPYRWPFNATRPGSGFLFIVLGFFLLILVAQIYRYRRVANDMQRQQTKWVLLCFFLGVGFLLLSVLVVLPYVTAPQSSALVALLVIHAGLALTQMSIPLAIGFALLRYRLWEVDVLLHHTLVYGLMTGGIIGAYILVVGYLSTIFHAEGNLLFSLIATGMIAVLFQPLRDRVQRGVKRLVYGDRDDPYSILARLGHRLDATLAPESVLPLVVDTIREALRLPYVAVTWETSDGTEQVTAAGSMTSGPLLCLPVQQQQTASGKLLLAPRDGDGRLPAADRRVLDDLLPQVSAAMQRVRLIGDLRQTTHELQLARERIILAHEEERRRLQRTLHDDLAPTLAALTLTSAGVERTLATDPATAARLAGELRTALRSAVSAVRTMAYALRPPLLNELGLDGAIRELGEQLQQAEGPACQIEISTVLPPIPAAIEVAAYYIAQEALRNVSRHAQASICRVHLWVVETPRAMHLEICDDGCGIASSQLAGVGLLGMRERATELGGTCLIEPRAGGGGTRVLARFPFSQEAA